MSAMVWIYDGRYFDNLHQAAVMAAGEAGYALLFQEGMLYPWRLVIPGIDADPLCFTDLGLLGKYLGIEEVPEFLKSLPSVLKVSNRNIFLRVVKSIATTRKIDAIKLIRIVSGLGLVESKDLVEELMNYQF